MSRTKLILTAVASIFVASYTTLPVDAAGSANIVEAGTLNWTPAQGLPPGAQMAVLYGDPSKTGPFALRFKFPAGYEIPTHSHSTDELITVISGNGRMAFGESASAAEAQPLPAGAFMSLPAGAWHHLWIDDQAVLELHSTGPFDVKTHQH